MTRSIKHFTVGLALSLALIFLLNEKSFCNLPEDVHKMTSEFADMTGATWDIVHKLFRLKNHTVKFIRLAAPVGSLVAAGAEIIFPEKSEELEAIRELHNFMDHKFSELSQHVERETNKILRRAFLRDYVNSVTIPLNEIARFYQYITDPIGNRTFYKEPFVTRCLDRQSPASILQIMKIKLVTQCRLPTQKEPFIFGKAFDLFTEIEKTHFKNFSFSMKSSYPEIKREILSTLTGISLITAVDKIRIHLEEAAYSNSSKVAEKWLNDFHEELLYEKEDDTDCWIRDAFENNEWLRELLYSFADTVRLDLLKTALLGSQCANISHNGDPFQTERELDQIESVINLIISHMAEWIPLKLESSWPTVMTKYAESALGDQESLDPAKYNETSELVKIQMDLRGPTRFFHNVLIMPSDFDGAKWLYSNCNSTTCIVLRQVKNANVIVSKYHDGQYYRAEKCYYWLPQFKDSIIAETRTWHNLFASWNDLDSLYNWMKQRVQGFADESLFPRVVIIHQEKWRGTDCTIQFGVTNATITIIPTHGVVEYFVNPALSDAHRYQFHFFL